jgi:hypothetical protein
MTEKPAGERRAAPEGPKRNWESMTAICTLILAVASIGTLIYAYAQLHGLRESTSRQIGEMQREATGQIGEMRDEARVQHLTALIDKFDSPAFQATRKSLAKKRVNQQLHRLRDLDADDEDWPQPEFDDELSFCDHMGLLVERGYLDRHDAWYAFGQWLFYLREDARPYLESLSNPADYRKCVALVDSIRTFEEKENQGAYLHPREDDLIGFYQSDIDTAQEQPPYRRRSPKRP